MRFVTTEGLDETIAYLNDLADRLADEKEWSGALSDLLEQGRRFAWSISPVVTGSYRAAHKVMTSGRTAVLGIDPAARNVRTGVPVERYAAAVEQRHQVYGRTAAYIEAAASSAAEQLVEEMIE